MYPAIPLSKAPSTPWSIFTLLVSMDTPGLIPASEGLELGTTEKSEHAAFLGEGYVIKITFPSPPIVLCF